MIANLYIRLIPIVNPCTANCKKTDKTAGRIKHIIKPLDHIDKLRGGNNYNPLEVKYWLLTTDKKTLDIDSRFIDENPDHGKSICIMPSEIKR